MANTLSHKTSPLAVLWGALGWHPAVKAWNTMAGAPVAPESVEVLDEGEGSSTYRLVGAGPGGASIIARRAPRGRALLERALYQIILPRLPVATRRCCGFTHENARFAWLFLTDGTGNRAAGTRHATTAHA